MKAGFKAFTVYRLRASIEIDTEELNALLGDLPAGDPAITQMRRSGFINPIAGLDELAVELNAKATLVALQTAVRLVPNKIVKRELHKAKKDWEDRYQRVPTGAETQDLKNRIIGTLMETAMIDYERINAIITGQHIFIDTASVKKAEVVLGSLRHQLGTLPVHPLTAEEPPVEKFTAWVKGEEEPQQLSVREAFKSKAKLEDKAVLSGKNVDLQGSTLSELLGEDYRIVALELGYYDDALHGTTSFMLDEHLAFRSVVWPDAIIDAAAEDAGDGDDTGINLAIATMTLAAGALEDLRDGVMASLGGEVALSAEKTDLAEAAIKKAQDGIFGLGTVMVDGEEVHDPLLQQVADFVIETQRASISGVQRQFRIGYNRSARILEALEAAGIVSPPGAGNGGIRTVWKTEPWQLGDTNLNTDFGLRVARETELENEELENADDEGLI